MPDPRAFSAEAVDAETARWNAEVETFLASQPPITEFEPARVRAAAGTVS